MEIVDTEKGWLIPHPEPKALGLKGGYEPTLEEKKRRAIAMRLNGSTYTAIANDIGCSAGNARTLVIGALKDMHTEDSHELRALYNARLEFLLNTLWPSVVDGNIHAVDQALKVMDRLERLHSLNDATQVITAREEGVLVIEGNKEEFTQRLQQLRKAQ